MNNTSRLIAAYTMCIVDINIKIRHIIDTAMGIDLGTFGQGTGMLSGVHD